MIDYIRGEIMELTPAYVVIETGGVGYFLHITLPAFTVLRDEKQVKLYAYEVIREDAHQLYGFLTVAERQLFLLLISVSGVGANTARMIMSSYSAEEIRDMIATGNVIALNAIKGIGTKTAQRIIVDLKDKIMKTAAGSEIPGSKSSVSGERRDEAVSALVMLGFAQTASQKIIDKLIVDDPETKVEQLIRKALKML